MEEKLGLSLKNNEFSFNSRTRKNIDNKSVRFCSFDTSLVKCFVKNKQPKVEEDIYSEFANLQISPPGFNIQLPELDYQISNQSGFKSKIDDKDTYNVDNQLMFIKDLGNYNEDQEISLNKYNQKRQSLNQSIHSNNLISHLLPILEDETINQNLSFHNYHQDSEIESIYTTRLHSNNEDNKSNNYKSPLINPYRDKKESIFSTECTYNDSDRHNSYKSLQSHKKLNSFNYSDIDDKISRGMNMTARPFYPIESNDKLNSSLIRFSTESKKKSTDTSNFSSKSSKGRRRLPDDNLEKYLIKVELILNDPRTTLMIRNIANKYDYYLFLSLINEEFAGKFDFFYLPVDFKVRKLN